MDWELIWWLVHGGVAFVVLVLSFIATPKKKKDDITILRIGN